MAEEQTVEQKAKDMGWRPKEEFRGDPEKFVDAENYVRRGEELLPILRANNGKLLGEVSTLRGEVSQLKETLKASQESIDALKEFNTEIARKAAKEQRKELVTAIEVARKEGDVDTAVRLTEQLDEHTEAIKEAEKKPVEKTVQAAVSETPEWRSWKSANPWFGTDSEKSDLAIAISMRLRREDATKDLPQREFLDKVAEEVERRSGGNPARQGASKVEASKSNGASGAGGGKSYSDLPADAKAVCDRQGKRLVGPGRAYKDMAAWRSKYASIYYEE